jgi:hypothetical protein
MANSKIPNVDLTDTFNTNRVRFNNLLDSVGDVSTLTTAATDVTSAINEHDAELGTITSGAMGTTADTVSGAIAELDDRLDSINNTQIQSAKLLMNDSSAVSAIKGKLDVHGDLYAGGILYTDQIKSASASEQVFINDTLELQANDINDVNNIHLRTALIHDGDTNTKLEFGTDTIDLHTGGTARVAITNNDVTISENLTVQDSAYVTGNLAVGGNTTIGGTLIVDGEVTFKAGANSNINLGDGDGDNVVFNADVNSSIIPNTDNTYDLGSSTKEWRHGYFDGTVNADNLAADSATLGTVKVTDLTAGRIVTVGTNGEVQDDANLTFDGTTLAATAAVDITGDLDVDNININGNTVTSTNTNGAINITPNGSGEVVISTATVSDLTNDRIVIAGTSGSLEDDANLTFDGTTFTVGATTIDQASGNTNIGGDLDVTGNLQVDGTLTVDGVVNMKAGSNGSVTIGDANTDNVVFSADVNSHITPNINNTYDLGSDSQQWRNIHVHGTGNIDTVSADDITVSNTLDVNTSATIATVKVEDLTDNRIVIVGTGGELEDDSNLTYDGTTFKVGTNFDVDVATGNTNIDGNLDVDGITDLDSTNVNGDLDVTGSFTTITTDGLTEGDNLYYTTSRADSDFDVRLVTKSTTNLAEGNNLYYTTARADSDAKNAISVMDAGGDGSLSYNNSTGEITYTGPSASEVRAHLVAGTGVNYDSANGVVSGEDATTSNKGIASFDSDNFTVSSGAVSIKDNGITLGTETTGNYVATIAGTTNEVEISGSGSENAAVTIGLPDDVTIGNNLTVSNDFTVGGSFTVAGEQRIAAQYIFLQDGTTGTPSLNSGITVDRGNEDSAVFQWNETGDYWEAGTKDDLNRLALQDDSANFTSLSVNNDLVVSGNLDIRGTTTTIDTTNLTIEDNLIILNGNQTGTPSTTLRSGLEIERGDDSNAKFQFNENTDEWEFIGPKTGTLAVTGDIGNATITLTAGTDLSTGGNFTTNQSGNETITINHADITRVDTTSTDTPGYGGTFEAVTGVTTNDRGHVTAIDVSTVTIPASDNTDTIYTHPTHPGDSATIDTGALTGATVISDLDLNITTDTLGHVTDANAAVATRTLTLADLGYTGATDANNYSLPEATSTVRGGIELFSNTDQSVAANAVTTTAGRTYGVQLNSAGQAVVNVPWVDTNTDTNTTYSAGNDLDLNGTTFNIESTLNHVNTITTAANTDLTLSTSGTGNIWLEPNVDGLSNLDRSVYMRCKGDSTQQLEFALNNNLQSIKAAQALVLKSNTSDVYIDPGSDDVYMRAQGNLTKQLTFTMGVTSQQIFASDDLNIGATGDIHLDADGNNIYFKNGDGADTWTWTLNDDATGSFTSPDYFTLEGFGGLELKSSYLFGGDNSIKLTSDASIYADGNSFVVTGDSDLQYLRFYGFDGVNNAQEIQATDGLRIEANEDIFIGNGQDINAKAGGSGGNITIEARSSNPPIGTDGIIAIDAETGLYLQADTGNITMSVGASGSSGAKLTYDLDANNQRIIATDALEMRSDNSGDIWLNSSANILIDAATGIIDLYHNGAQDVRFDVATTDTLKLYTGTSTLNSTFSGDDLTVQGDVNSVSDVRTKENIETVENGLDLVSQLRGVWYNKIGEEDRKVGVIAQEVEEVLPEVVHTDTEGMKAVDYGKMVGVLIEAIKELKQEIDELKGK